MRTPIADVLHLSLLSAVAASAVAGPVAASSDVFHPPADDGVAFGAFSSSWGVGVIQPGSCAARVLVPPAGSGIPTLRTSARKRGSLRIGSQRSSTPSWTIR